VGKRRIDPGKATAPRAPRRPEPAPEPEPEWSAADEAWFARVLADAPPLGPRQKERLRALLDVSGGGDGAA
jgi:hypothetical protein